MIFNEYIDYTQITDLSLKDINEVLTENNIILDLGDNFCNDWAGYSYYFCKSLNELDDETISSFVYIVTWFMTGSPVDIFETESNEYYNNDLIIGECSKIYYSHLIEYESKIELCKRFFDEIYQFYLHNHKNYAKKIKRINFALDYAEYKLFENVPGASRTDKFRELLENYYKTIEK